MSRISLNGKGQALDGDLTTSGAVCIATTTTTQGNERRVLREGDPTTECPACGKTGTVAEGVPLFRCEGRPLTFDGALVACGCSHGSNRVIAPLEPATR
ncbi:PAAR domain-containing protein [Pseudomonas fulva]|nr:PAAR domain-containing protein [Pseudomonas fulva]MBF8781556.1 PAAR domain-containing protein [Pseudomonas fulva]